MNKHFDTLLFFMKTVTLNELDEIEMLLNQIMLNI